MGSVMFAGERMQDGTLAQPRDPETSAITKTPVRLDAAIVSLQSF